MWDKQTRHLGPLHVELPTLILRTVHPQLLGEQPPRGKGSNVRHCPEMLTLCPSRSSMGPNWNCHKCLNSYAPQTADEPHFDFALFGLSPEVSCCKMSKGRWHHCPGPGFKVEPRWLSGIFFRPCCVRRDGSQSFIYHGFASCNVKYRHVKLFVNLKAPEPPQAQRVEPVGAACVV